MCSDGLASLCVRRVGASWVFAIAPCCAYGDVRGVRVAVVLPKTGPRLSGATVWVLAQDEAGGGVTASGFRSAWTSRGIPLWIGMRDPVLIVMFDVKVKRSRPFPGVVWVA